MTYDQGIVADIVLWGFAALNFGIWQDSFSAGMFAFIVLLIWKGESK